eukprot:scaffold4582_cov166-Amphora_coffeaeformis.AAC.6
MKKITFILHGNHRKKDQLKAAVEKASKNEFEISFVETQAVGDGMTVSKRAVEEGAEYLIACGGDGTVNEVVNGWIQSASEARENVIIGVLPGGTGNDFSKSIRAKGGIEQLLQYIRSDEWFEMDLGWMRFQDQEGNTSERYFDNIADVGIGGQVVMNTAKAGKWMGADLIYFTSILKSFFQYQHASISLSAPGFEWQGIILSLVFANARYFGSGLCIAPEADLSDGQMEIIKIAKVSVLDYLMYMGKVKRGEKIVHPEVCYHRFTECKVESLGDPVPIDMDGEFVGYTPLEIKMHQKVVKLLGRP